MQKASTQRRAVASGQVLLGEEAYRLVAANAIKKGDVLTIAQLAGIMGAKHTSLLVRPAPDSMLCGSVGARCTESFACSDSCAFTHKQPAKPFLRVSRYVGSLLVWAATVAAAMEASYECCQSSAALESRPLREDCLLHHTARQLI